MSDIDRRLVYSIAEACAALGVGRSTLFELVRTKQIASVKLGRRRLIPVVALQRYLARLEDEQGG